MRKKWLVVPGIFITGLASASGPPPASVSASASIRNESAHELGIDTCRQVRILEQQTWQLRIYAVSPAISDAMLAAVTGETDKMRAGLAALPPDQIARWRQTALFLAVTSNHPDAVRTLIVDGADPNARAWIPPYTNRYYRRLVAYMSGDPRFGGHSTIRYFQDKSLMQNKGQWFPHMLIQAAKCNETQVIEALIQGGASVRARLSSGLQALDIAVIQGNADAARILLDRGADPCDFAHRMVKHAHRARRKLHDLADIARKQGLPAQLVARLACHAPKSAG